tara:strand:- start:67 stop:1173 length:1107 start_codon:yes stop_codon:yes gene_type:complete
MDNNEKIQLDDITFDDVIGGDGVETVTVDEKPVIDEEKVEKEEIVEGSKVEDEESIETTEETSEEKIEEPEEDIKDDLKDDDDQTLSDDDTVVGEILNTLGYEVDHEYEDTAEGLTQLTKDLAGKMAAEQMEEVLNSFPLVKNHLDYVLNGGESQEFMKAYDPNMDYNQITIEEDDFRSQKGILNDYFTLKGHDQDFIQELLTDYEESGKLYNKSEAARKALGKVQIQQKENLVKEQQEVMRQQQEQQKEFWEGVAKTIEDSKEFVGLQVPQKDKRSFFNYISKPVNKEGYTQRDIDHSEAEMETKLAIDYLMFKGFNLEQIINTKARTKNTKSLKDKISRNQEVAKSARKTSRRTKSFDIDDLDLSI